MFAVFSRCVWKNPDYITSNGRGRIVKEIGQRLQLSIAAIPFKKKTLAYKAINTMPCQ